MNASADEINETNTVVPLRGVRGMVADKMVKSLHEAAQLTHHASCDASALLRCKNTLADRGVKVSIEDLLMFAVVRELQTHTDINGVVKDREIHLSGAVHLSIAIALPGNLLVAPTILNAHELDVIQLRAARQDLARRANNNKLSVTEMTSGTFTISNLGLSRVEHFTPILNSPQIGILGIGCILEKPVKTVGGINWHPSMGLSLTFDHRAIDGAPAAAFLSDLCGALEGLQV